MKKINLENELKKTAFKEMSEECKYTIEGGCGGYGGGGAYNGTGNNSGSGKYW